MNTELLTDKYDVCSINKFVKCTILYIIWKGHMYIYDTFVFPLFVYIHTLYITQKLKQSIHYTYSKKLFKTIILPTYFMVTEIGDEVAF